MVMEAQPDPSAHHRAHSIRIEIHLRITATTRVAARSSPRTSEIGHPLTSVPDRAHQPHI